MAQPIDIHTHRRGDGLLRLSSCRLGIEPLPDECPCSAGIHPWDAELLRPRFDELSELLGTLPIAAVGEIGLDYAVSVDRSAQTEAFERQLQIAVQRALPVVIHSVRATNDVLGALRRAKVAKAVFHGFTGNGITAAQIVSAGYCLSFGARSLHSPKAVEVLGRTPLERLFFETDDDATPIEEIYRRAAKIKGINVDSLETAVEKNYKELFL